MTAPVAAGVGIAGARDVVDETAPKPDHTVGRKQHDEQEAETDQSLKTPAVETDRNQRVKREGAQDHVNQRADERADRMSEPADHGDDQKIDGGFDAGGAGRD